MTTEDILRQHDSCYAYNATFGFYHDEVMPRHKCQSFVDRENRNKGGHWEVRRLIDFRDHFESLKTQ
jgi:hypothetical protein